MLYVGIDWASDLHDVCLTNDLAQTRRHERLKRNQVAWALSL